MRVSTTAAISALACADAVFGAHLTNARRARHEARAMDRASRPKEFDGFQASSSNNSNVEYSSNWAGAVLIDTGFTEVTGQVTAVAASGGANAAASAWVGIDGDTCSSAILQTGIDMYGDGSFDAWYEWYPDYAYNFNIDISAGDEILMTVTAASKSSGTAVIENLTTGDKVSKTFTGETDTLCETNAEWIVEDFESGGSLVTFADFGTVEFTSASATKSGSSVGLSGATIMDIRQSGTVYTDCSATTDTMTCSYTG